MKRFLIPLLFFSFAAFLIACEHILPGSPEDASLLDGPVEGLSAAEQRQFLRGDAAFNTQIFSEADGLGPTFVATSCASCHAGDGKGHPFTTLIRFGQSDSTGNQFLHMGGPQLQNRALPGFEPESIPAGAPFASFNPPAVTGLGFISYVKDAAILAMADPNDANGDGISGVPNWIKLANYTPANEGAISQNGRYIGRFGKKAGVYTLLQQSVEAYNQDMGITSTYNPRDVYTGQIIDPEVSNSIVQDVVFYLHTLKAPIQRNTNDPKVIAGKQVFLNTGCGGCHAPSLQTGNAPIAALSNKTFYPYTDMLLHDMGPGLNDGYTEGNALPAEWRTPALWGLGLSKDAQGGSYFLLHDGRAHSIEEAILLHGGEADNSKAKFQQLSAGEKEQLIAFLESL